MHQEELARYFTGRAGGPSLTPAALAQLAQCAVPRALAAGETLFHEGETHGDLLLVRSGKVQLLMRVPGRGAVPILTLGPGQVVGWSAVVGQGEMTTSAVALEPTEVFALPAARLRDLCESDHEFGYLFMQRMAGALARRLVATRLQLLDLFAVEAAPIPLPEDDHA